MLNKVMFFLPTLGGGGAERTVIQLANRFAEQGMDIDMVVCNLQGEKGKLLPEVNPKIQLVDLNCGRVMSAITPLKQLLRAIDYDVVIATQTHSNIACGIAKKLAKVDTRLIFREVSTPSKNIKLTGLSKWLLKKLVRWTYPMAQQVVCVSDGVLADFREYYAYQHDNLMTIYNPVLDDAYFEKRQAGVEHRFFNDEHKVVLAVGRLTEAKNFELLINSFAQLQQRHPEARLIILGEGERRSQLEQQIVDLELTDVVDLPGFDPNPYAYFKYVDMFVLSSNWEGLPGVLIQALASKVKLVSTDCPSGPREILANGQFGLLVPCAEQTLLIDAMQQALYGNYVQYDLDEFEQHCQQFQPAQVQQHYLQLMELAAC